MPISLTCATCRTKFSRGLTNYRSENKAHFCSRTCYHAHRTTKRKIKCATCQKLFMPNRVLAMRSKRNYCPLCRMPVACICPVCGEKFVQRPSRIRKRKRLFCSTKCKATGQRKDWALLSRSMLKQRWVKEFGRGSLVCCRCGHDRVFNVIIHHKQYVSKGGTNAVENLEPLCLNCHGIEHYEHGHDKGE